jgi:hypothetical protein
VGEDISCLSAYIIIIIIIIIIVIVVVVVVGGGGGGGGGEHFLKFLLYSHVSRKPIFFFSFSLPYPHTHTTFAHLFPNLRSNHCFDPSQ